MRAKQDRNLVIFELEGHLEFETTVKFKEACEEILQKAPSTRLVFDFERLKFVGSSGINHFMTTMKELLSFAPAPKMIRVSKEFDRIFNAYRTAKYPFPIYENVEMALVAFDNPDLENPKKSKKRKKVREV